jgi:hypothetical protein
MKEGSNYGRICIFRVQQNGSLGELWETEREGEEIRWCKVADVVEGEDEEISLDVEDSLVVIPHLEGEGKIPITFDIESGSASLGPLPKIDSYELRSLTYRGELTSVVKGKLGELLVMHMLSMEKGVYCQETEYGAPYDLNYDTEGPRIDVKYSMWHKNQPSEALYWKFHLSNHSTGDAYDKVSETKTKKDYSQSCDYIICVGQYPNGTVEFFLFPSGDPAIAKCRHSIRIPVNFTGSMYEPYKMDLPGMMTE